MATPTLGYWDIRGFAQQIRHILQYLGVEYTDKRYSHGPAPAYSREAWLAEKFTLGLKFPNIPYFIDGDVKITESNAILKYIARTRGPELIPADAVAQALSDEVEGVIYDVRQTMVEVAYGQGTLEAYEALRDDHAKKLQYLNDHLEENQYAVGDNITYVDFYLYEVLYQTEKFAEALKTEILQPFKNLNTYLRRIESLPQFKEYLQSPPLTEKSMYSLHATLFF